MPKFTEYNSDEEYKYAWNRVIPKMSKGDLISTFNSNSMISKIIAKIDKGSWSHSAIYIGDYKIAEAISRGVVRRDINVYKSRNIHIGIYRPYGC
jgi:cell wall-associated NlpC family hydrolase